MMSCISGRHPIHNVEEENIAAESIADAAGNIIIDDDTIHRALLPSARVALLLNQQKKSSCSSSTIIGEVTAATADDGEKSSTKKQTKHAMLREQTSNNYRRATTGPQQLLRSKPLVLGRGGGRRNWLGRKTTDSTFDARSASVGNHNHNNVSPPPLHRAAIINKNNNTRPSTSTLLHQNGLLPHLKTVDITSDDDIQLLSEQHKIWTENLFLRQSFAANVDGINEQEFDEGDDIYIGDEVARRRGTATASSASNVPWMNFSRRRSTKMAAAIHDQANNVRNYVQSMLQPAVDNKLALKLFGSAGAILREQERQTASARWIVHPASNFRFYWDLLMLLFLLTNMVVLPVSIAFFFNALLSTGWLIFNCISDTIFIIDIIINFRTGVMHPDSGAQVILDPKVIAKNYIRSWFFVDFISSIPFDYIILFLSLVSSQSLNQQFAQAGRAFRLLRLAKVLSLMKLLRISRLLRYLSQFEAVYVSFYSRSVNSVKRLDQYRKSFLFGILLTQFINLAGVFMRIFNFLGLMLLIGHWSGCIQFLVPVLQGLPEDSWVVINELPNLPWFEQYTWSLWQALSHQLSIGYGRFPPQSVTDVWLTTLSMISGASCYALFIGHASNLIQSLDSSRRNYRDKWKQVEEYMVYRRLPPPLRRRIADYYDNRFRGKLFNEVEILEELNDPLKEAIINFNCRDLVKSVPFFTHADPNFVTSVITKLHYEFFQPGDVIVKESTIGDKMYFIQEGVVEIFTSNKTTPNSFVHPPSGGAADEDAADSSASTRETVITCLSDGSYFGEICLLTKAKRVASVRAQTYCSLFSLQAESFNAVLEQYPIMRHTLESVAAERLNKIGQNSVQHNNVTPGMSPSPSTLLPCDSPPEDLQKVSEMLQRVASYSRRMSPSRDFFRRRSTYYVAPISSAIPKPDLAQRSLSSSGNMQANPGQPPTGETYASISEHNFLSVPSYTGVQSPPTAAKQTTPVSIASISSNVRENDRRSCSSSARTTSSTATANSGMCHTTTVKISETEGGISNVRKPSITAASVSSSPFCSPVPSPLIVPAHRRSSSRTSAVANDANQMPPPTLSPPTSTLQWLRKQTLALAKAERLRYNNNSNHHAAADDGCSTSFVDETNKNHQDSDDSDDKESEKFLSACTSI